MKILQVKNDKSEICRQVLEELTLWFGLAEDREAYIAEASKLIMFASYLGVEPVGMLTLKKQSQINLEIAVLGVKPDFHRLGTGKALIAAARTYAVSKNIKMLSVKTLAKGNPDPNYAKTRLFYEANGFELFEEFPDLWNESNPCALYIMSI